MGGKTRGVLYEYRRHRSVLCDRLPGRGVSGHAGHITDVADQISADLAHASDGEREAKIETRRKWPK